MLDWPAAVFRGRCKYTARTDSGSLASAAAYVNALSPMTPAHHKACSREWESRLIVSRVLLLDSDRTPTTARQNGKGVRGEGGLGGWRTCLLGRASVGMQGPSTLLRHHHKHPSHPTPTPLRTREREKG